MHRTYNSTPLDYCFAEIIVTGGFNQCELGRNKERVMQNASDRNNKDLIVGISAAVLFIVVGIVLLYVGFYFYNKVEKIRESGVKTEGTIIRYERRGTRTPQMKDMFVVPIVKFQTVTGQEIVVEGKVDNTSILQNLCEDGEQIEIIYDPLNPKNAVINTFAELWFVPLLTWVIGIGFILVPPFTIWKHYKGQR